MTEAELKAIEERARENYPPDHENAKQLSEEDVPALIAEVRRLRAIVKQVRTDVVVVDGVELPAGADEDVD